MRSTIRLLALVSMVSGLVAAPVLAASSRGATKRAGVTAQGPKTTTGKASAPKGPTMKTTTTKTKSVQGPKAQSSTAKGATMKSTHASSPKKGGTTSGTTSAAASGKSAKSAKTSPSGSTPSAPATSTTPTATWTPDNPVAQKLSTKTNILNRVQNALPPGSDLNAATAGFKNFGQFVAAVNVSTNLGIPFADLKAAMTGLNMDGTPAVTSTGQTTASLGQAIQQLKPGVNAEMEAQKAETEATRLINETPTTGTTTPSKKKTAKGPGTSTSGGSF